MKLLLSAFFVLAMAAPALACSCARGPDRPLPPFVIEARVISVQPVHRGVAANLRVLRMIRGEPRRMFTVHTPAHSAACGVTFRRGDVLRVGFGMYNGRHTANLCQQMNLERMP
jgi:hypothetical protein